MYKLRGRAEPYLFLLPALLFYVVFMVFPMFQSLALSFTRWEGLEPSGQFVGLGNYQAILFNDPVALLALKNNVIWVAWTLFIPTVAGLLLATLLNEKVRGRLIFRTIFYGPAVLPLVAVGIMWSWMYNPNFGFINEGLRAVGLKSFTSAWLGDPAVALLAVLITGTWERIGFPMVLYLAGLQSIPSEQHEAAEIDGANAFQRFRHITLPLLRETHVIVITLQVIASFKVFDLVYSMTWGGPGYATQVLATWMYFNTFVYFHKGYGSAIAWVIALITMLITFPYIRIMARR